MQIYLLEHDPNYAAIAPIALDVNSELMDLQADVLMEFNPPQFRITDQNKKRGNFFYFNDTTLVFDRSVYEIFKESIRLSIIPACGGPDQLFKVDVDEIGPLFLMNVISQCNPLNHDESRWDKEDWRRTIEMNALVFHEHRIRSHTGLFKIPELHYRPILVATDRKKTFEDFYDGYHKHGLTGLKFTEIFSS